MTGLQLLDNDDLVRWCKGLLTALVVLHSLSFAFGFVLLYKTSEYSDSERLDEVTGFPTGTEFFAEMYSITGGVIIISILMLVILYFQWLNRTARNAQLIAGLPLKISPGWAIGWYFVPIVSFFMPYRSMKEIYCISTFGYERDEYSPPWEVVVWWLTFVVGWILFRAAIGMSRMIHEVGGWRIATVFDLASSVLHISAALLLMNMMDELLGLQKDMAARRNKSLEMEAADSITSVKISYVSPTNDQSES